MAIIKVKTGGITADAVIDALIADDVVGTEHLTANEVDTTALGADAVTGAQLADNAVNSEHYTDGSVDTAHIADANVTAAKMFSGFANGITMVDQWRLTANNTTSAVITSNLEQVDNASQAEIGSAMTQSSGIFTFPSTGLYLVRLNLVGEAIADDNILGYINTTLNNSSYADDAVAYFSGDGSNTGSSSSMTECFVNVTNTTNVKVKFTLVSIGSGSAVYGNTGENLTFFTFIRLGDSQ